MSAGGSGSEPPGSPGFPRGFLWGAATSAFQIEGSPLADGAGPSNWYRFTHTPGRIRNDDTADIACDHYRRLEEDVEWLARLGVGAYRFSLAWTRILPEGRGRVNAAGVAFYERLVDLLLARDIVPCVTVHHWDYPAALQDLGGWTAPQSAEWFADYAEVVFRKLGDRVRFWTTINEPWVIMDAGYVHGVHAPGLEAPELAPVVAHNLLRAHGLAVQRFRAVGSGQIGIVVNLEPKVAASGSEDDLRTARQADAYMNRLFLDPIFRSAYPEELREVFGADWPAFAAEDFDVIGTPLDFVGVNYYTRGVTRFDPTGVPVSATVVPVEGSSYTDTGWEIHPQSFEDVLRWTQERIGALPIYVTENGAALPEPASVSGNLLEDPRRVAYYRDHLRAARRAIDAGVRLRGYFAWSLMDNFEWSQGYARRFGLLHVDFATLKRTPKSSFHFYGDVIRTNGASLDSS